MRRLTVWPETTGVIGNSLASASLPRLFTTGTLLTNILLDFGDVCLNREETAAGARIVAKLVIASFEVVDQHQIGGADIRLLVEEAAAIG
jgi:hypothetical protein